MLNFVKNVESQKYTINSQKFKCEKLLKLHDCGYKNSLQQ